MRYRYLDDFRRGISVFAIFAYGIAVLGTPQCPTQSGMSLSPSQFSQLIYRNKSLRYFLDLTY